MKNKERLRNGHSSEGSKRGDDELQCGILSWVWTRMRTVNGKPGEIQESVEFINKNVPVWVSLLWQGYPVKVKCLQKGKLSEEYRKLLLLQILSI